MSNKLPIILRLIKFRLGLLVSFSGFTGYMITGRVIISSLLCVLTGIFLMSSGSLALNQFQELKYDALMRRTSRRPLPSGEIKPLTVLLLSIFLITSGFIILSFLGIIPAMLGLASVVLYNFIYTPLKQVSLAAMLPGALTGALPPLIGWTASGLFVFHPVAVYVAFFVFLWQIPHFWLLLIRYREDYAKAGFRLSFPYKINRSAPKLVFYWAVFTSLYLFSFPLFKIRMEPSIAVFFTLVNTSFIFLFRNFLLGKRSEPSPDKAFIVINIFALIVFMVLIYSRSV